MTSYLARVFANGLLTISRLSHSSYATAAGFCSTAHRRWNLAFRLLHLPSLLMSGTTKRRPAGDLKAGTDVRVITHKDDKTAATTVHSGYLPILN